MQLAHGYTEQTEDGMTWRIDRMPNNDSIIYRHIYEDIINEQTVGSLAAAWYADRERVQEYLPFNRQPVKPLKNLTQLKNVGFAMNLLS